jgi:cbb3-type cytochrome oxidase subunit 3
MKRMSDDTFETIWMVIVAIGVAALVYWKYA